MTREQIRTLAELVTDGWEGTLEEAITETTV